MRQSIFIDISFTYYPLLLAVEVSDRLEFERVNDFKLENGRFIQSAYFFLRTVAFSSKFEIIFYAIYLYWHDMLIYILITTLVACTISKSK